MNIMEAIKQKTKEFVTGCSVLFLIYFGITEGPRLYERLARIFSSPDPAISSMKLEEYSLRCRNDNFDRDCKGKFVIFDGKITKISSGQIRIDAKGLGFDVSVSSTPSDSMVGSLIRFSGYIDGYHTFNDDLSYGKIVSVLRTPEQAKADEVAQDRAYRERKLAEKRRDPDVIKYSSLWKVTPDQYIAAEGKLIRAGVSCKNAAKSAAKWQSETVGWLQSDHDSWSMGDSNNIRVTGSNLKMQNGFGAWRNVQYTCNYDIKGDLATLTMVQ